MSFKSLVNFFKLDGLEEDDEFESYVDEFEEEEPQRTAPVRNHSTSREVQDDMNGKSKIGGFRGSKPKVVPLNRAISEVKIIFPSSFEDSQEICNTLLESKPVVVNLEGFDADDAQRIMDFISGCIYAINGKYHQISKYVFIFTPEQVDISGDTLNHVKEESQAMPTINREF